MPRPLGKDVLGCAMEEGAHRWWGVEDGQSLSALCGPAGPRKSQKGFLLRVFLGRKSMLKRYEWGRNIIPACLKISIFPAVL